MSRSLRLSITLAITLALTVFAPTSAAERHVDAYRLEAQVAVAAVTAPAPCSDGAYRLSGGRWTSALKWHFRASSTPSSLVRSAVRGTLQRAFSNIVNARNDCGRPDRVDARARYMGTTTRRPSCNLMDGYNVVGFRNLPSDTLAQTCWWTINGRILEADIMINSSLPWATSLAGCRNKFMLEAVMTHEVGHAFGLGHVGERRHGRLTMSTRLDGPCNNQESTLGLGDLRGLEKLY